jgi:hypothetical protein
VPPEDRIGKVDAIDSPLLEPTMSFQITGLPLSQFSPLFSMSDEELARQGAVRVTADERPGFPCRVSLQDAEIGERLILLNYEHLPVATPYRSRHAIYVRESATEAQLAVDEVPHQMRPRLLVPGTAIEKLIEQMFAHPGIAFLHVHNAKWGCYAARVDRA